MIKKELIEAVDNNCEIELHINYINKFSLRTRIVISDVIERKGYIQLLSDDSEFEFVLEEAIYDKYVYNTEEDFYSYKDGDFEFQIVINK